MRLVGKLIMSLFVGVSSCFAAQPIAMPAVQAVTPPVAVNSSDVTNKIIAPATVSADTSTKIVEAPAAGSQPAAQVVAPAEGKVIAVPNQVTVPIAAPAAASSPVVGIEKKQQAGDQSAIKPTQETLSEDEVVGIDTADLDEPQGNWLFKRMWWQRAETQYEKIKALVDAIMESRMAFFAKRTEWDKTVFDPFYLEIGVGRGVLEELIANAIAQLNHEREKDGQLSQEERDLLAAFETEKATLEQLQKDIQKINAIDSAIDEAITTLIGQINAARNFEKQSWQNLKKIAQELSDKNARDLYYGMATFWQNTNDIGNYIQTPFLQYFEQLGVTAKEHIAKVTDSMKALKEKGIDFKQQWQNLEAKHALAHDAQMYAEGVHQEQHELQEKETKNERGFLGTIVHGVTNVVSSIVNTINNSIISLWNVTLGRFFNQSKPVNQLEESNFVAPEADKKKHA